MPSITKCSCGITASPAADTCAMTFPCSPKNDTRQTGILRSMAARLSLMSSWRFLAVCLLAFTALSLFCAGLAEIFTPSSPASRAPQAAFPDNPRYAPLQERARLLQSSVDSVALSLGSVLEKLAETDAKLESLGTALSSLTFDLGGGIHFTAWEGTRILHAPFNSGIQAMDFADALDEHGNAFVLEMRFAAEQGGGFLVVSLPSRSSVPGQGRGAPAFAEQLLYVRAIPHSGWHIAAFMPLDAPLPEGGFSPAFTAKGKSAPEKARPFHNMALGLCLSGLALAGLAALLLICGRGHKEGKRESGTL